MAFYRKFGTNWFNLKNEKRGVKLESYYFFPKCLISGKKITFLGEKTTMFFAGMNQVVIGYCE